MRTVRLPDGNSLPALGLGTWNMGDAPARREEEIATIRLALDLGVRLIDTAEMYGEGQSESLIGAAIAGRRDEAFLVSKVYPHNASRRGAIAACERSLKRLGTDHLDLYLLHWRGAVALEETLEAFLRLQAAGKICYFGVSNLDLDDMQAWYALTGGDGVATDQVLYNLTRRGIELDLLPWLRARHIPLMAYSPVEQGRLLREPRLIDFAHRHGISPAHAALGWLLAQEDLIVIPKTSRRAHLRENLHALEAPLSPAQCAELDALFPAPRQPVPLAML
ncbi:MAG: aldo/keto reductase [Proteobacteria bacterium]|nr:aldo/keto reductase [Pseudomonadota bacterium]